MTDKEHALMMMMFTRQTMYIQMLLDLLENKEIIQKGEIPAFDFVVRNDPAKVSLFLQVKGQYDSFANQLEMALPDLPKTLPDKT